MVPAGGFQGVAGTTPWSGRAAGGRIAPPATFPGFTEGNLYNARLMNSLVQPRLPHQITVAFPRGAASFVDRPGHQGLASPHVAGGKDARLAGRVFALGSSDIPPFVAGHSELVKERRLGPEETQGQQNRRSSIRVRTHARCSFLQPFPASLRVVRVAHECHRRRPGAVEAPATARVSHRFVNALTAQGAGCCAPTRSRTR